MGVLGLKLLASLHTRCWELFVLEPWLGIW
jgi:hypothetical protein